MKRSLMIATSALGLLLGCSSRSSAGGAATDMSATSPGDRDGGGTQDSGAVATNPGDGDGGVTADSGAINSVPDSGALSLVQDGDFSSPTIASTAVFAAGST